VQGEGNQAHLQKTNGIDKKEKQARNKDGIKKK
jgi:hypothetical protein